MKREAGKGITLDTCSIRRQHTSNVKQKRGRVGRVAVVRREQSAKQRQEEGTAEQ